MAEFEADLRIFFHVGSVFGGAGGAVTLGAVIKRGLGGGKVGAVAAPGVEGGFLEGAAEGEAELPWSGAELVEGVEMFGGAGGGLSTGEEHDSGDGGRDGFLEDAKGEAGGLLDGSLLAGIFAGEDHVGLEESAFEADAMFAEGLEEMMEGSVGDFEMAFNGVIAIHEDLGFDDGNEAGFLAESGEAGQGVSVGLEREAGGCFWCDFDDRAPFGEAGAELGVFGEAVAQAVQAFGDAVAGEIGEGFGAFIDLDAGYDVLALEEFGHGSAIGGFLADGFVVKDDAADELAQSFDGEKESAVIAAGFFGGSDADAFQALFDGAGAFVRGENSLGGSSKGAGGGFEILMSTHAGIEAAFGGNDKCDRLFTKTAFRLWWLRRRLCGGFWWRGSGGFPCR